MCTLFQSNLGANVQGTEDIVVPKDELHICFEMGYVSQMAFLEIAVSAVHQITHVLVRAEYTYVYECTHLLFLKMFQLLGNTTLLALEAVFYAILFCEVEEKSFFFALESVFAPESEEFRPAVFGISLTHVGELTGRNSRLSGVAVVNIFGLLLARVAVVLSEKGQFNKNGPLSGQISFHASRRHECTRRPISFFGAQHGVVRCARTMLCYVRWREIAGLADGFRVQPLSLEFVYVLFPPLPRPRARRTTSISSLRFLEMTPPPTCPSRLPRSHRRERLSAGKRSLHRPL